MTTKQREANMTTLHDKIMARHAINAAAAAIINAAAAAIIDVRGNIIPPSRRSGEAKALVQRAESAIAKAEDRQARPQCPK